MTPPVIMSLTQSTFEAMILSRSFRASSTLADSVATDPAMWPPGTEIAVLQERTRGPSALPSAIMSLAMPSRSCRPPTVLAEFDRTVGLAKLMAVHLNDSRNGCGSHKDRHERLGQGCIGEAALRRIVCHPALAGRPFILETPSDREGYIREIAKVKTWWLESQQTA